MISVSVNIMLDLNYLINIDPLWYQYLANPHKSAINITVLMTAYIITLQTLFSIWQCLCQVYIMLFGRA